jgi:ribosomal protein L37AE/L43A
MKPSTHTKLVTLSPWWGLIVFLVGTSALWFSKKGSLEEFGVLTAISLIVVFTAWVVTRWFVSAECPECGRAMKMKKGEETFVYECPQCPKLVDTGRKIPTIDSIPEP